MVKASLLSPIRFAFRDNNSLPDKLRGLQEFGPFSPSTPGIPKFGFVFPTEYRDDANKLYLVLKNGVGPFKGVETTFRFPLRREQVSAVTDFSVQGKSPREAARIYAGAVLNSVARQRRETRPDLFFIIHPETPSAEPETPYYECKAALLKAGLLSQSVTHELITDDAKFRWSAANIALGAFVKMGGVPWVVYGEELEQDLILGLGRAYLYEPTTRHTTGYIGFTACFSARGVFKFLSLAEVAQTKSEYLRLLGKAVSNTLQRAQRIGSQTGSLTLHVPKEFGREELSAVRSAVSGYSAEVIPEIAVTKVVEESSFFAIDPRFSDGVPMRGTVIQTTDRDYMLYTEGREEKESWGRRLPVALRVTPQGLLKSPQRVLSLLRQINDLSQVNWRGFNARSQPISIYYGSLIARLLSHIAIDDVPQLTSPESLAVLENRMWFI